MEEEESAEKDVFSCWSRNNGKISRERERERDTDPYFYYYAVSVVSV